MTLTATITVDASDKETARRVIEAAGFKVVRFAVKKAPAGITARTDNVRASAVLDMPAGLEGEARKAYVRGYARGCMSYVKKHGPVSVQTKRGEHADLASLRQRTIDQEWDRHPAAHRAGLSELKKYQERWGEAA